MQLKENRVSVLAVVIWNAFKWFYFKENEQYTDSRFLFYLFLFTGFHTPFIPQSLYSHLPLCLCVSCVLDSLSVCCRRLVL
jgi:hypothetical protein